MKSRHAMVDVVCEWCGITFSARKQRVDKGQSRWCSMPHYKEWLVAQGSQRKNIGKENAIIQWDKSGNIFRAYWYDENMKYTSTPWARWAWELNHGEIPEGYKVGFKDENSKNTVVANLYLQSPEDFGKKMSRLSKGRVFSDEHKQALRDGRVGIKFSEEHKQHMGDATRDKWNKGLFDAVHVGENHHHWRGGVSYKDYPKEFHEVKKFIRERDNNMCQICGQAVYRSRHGHVHHIDGNKKYNDPENLILVCSTCHGKIHSDNPAPPPILAFRAKLEWNKP